MLPYASLSGYESLRSEVRRVRIKKNERNKTPFPFYKNDEKEKGFFVAFIFLFC